MASQGSTMFTVGTLLRHAQDAGAQVRVLVSGVWLEGVVVGADGMGVVLDDGRGNQVLTRLDSIVAVGFTPSHIEGTDGEGTDPRPGTPGRERGPIETGPVGG